MRPQAPFLIFDIETVPDIPLLRYHYEPSIDFTPTSDWKDLRIVQAIQEQKQIAFPPPLFHSVVSLCAVYVDPQSYRIIDGFKQSVSVQASYEDFLKQESQILKNFWEFSQKYKEIHRPWYDSLQSDQRMSDYQRKKLKPLPVTFCGYNISGFDLPVIEQRSIKHLLTCPITDYAKELGLDSYRYKYALDKVYDLCAYVSNFTPRSSVGLDVLAKSLGLAGKMAGMDGSQVAKRYFNDEAIAQIEDYCAVDVLITYGVFLAIQKFRGLIDASLFKEVSAQFETFLLNEGKPESYRELALNSRGFF